MLQLYLIVEYAIEDAKIVKEFNKQFIGKLIDIASDGASVRQGKTM